MQPEFQLTPEEFALVNNGSWLITKQRVIGKVYGMYGMLSEKYGEILEDYKSFIPDEIPKVSPKIYKGELYRQLPYVMLDHPRYFEKEHFFAIRNFFWWGNHFSIHLLLGGRYKERFGEKLLKHIKEGSLDTWYIGVSEDPWEHHFENDNYRPIHEIRYDYDFGSLTYWKIGKWHPLDEWKDAYSFYLKSYAQLLECMT